MKIRLLAFDMFVIATTATQAMAEPIDPSLLVGSWKLTAIYDQYPDGRRRETWGTAPQGLLQFTSNGIVSVQLSSGDRQPLPRSVPAEPVGAFNAYFGTYTVDAPTGPSCFKFSGPAGRNGTVRASSGRSTNSHPTP